MQAKDLVVENIFRTVNATRDDESVAKNDRGSEEALKLETLPSGSGPSRDS